MKITVLALFLLFVWNAFAWADVPKYISFQGELTDSQGTRIASSKSVTFKLHSAASGGSILWSEAQTLTPANGIVSAIVGGATAGGVNLAFDTQYWLGVTVSPDAEMSPRIRLTTSPYAFIAKYLDTGAAAYGALSVAETVTASKFVGNGAGLTGVTASAAADTDWTIATASTIYRLGGNVGIGTSNPADSLTVNGSFTVDSPTFYVDAANNRIGVGTATPSQKLEVAGIVYSTSGGFKFPDGTTQTTAAVAAGAQPDTDWTMTGGTSGNIYKSAGNVGIGTTAPADSLDIAGGLIVDSPTLFVDDLNNKVGIGTANPTTASLHIIGNDVSLVEALRIERTTGGGGGTIRMHGTSANTIMGNSNGGGFVIATLAAYPILFATNATHDNNVLTSGERMKIETSGGIKFSDSVVVSDTVLVVNKQSGKVGIGTAAPAAALDVSVSAAQNPILQLTGTGTGNHTALAIKMPASNTFSPFEIRDNASALKMSIYSGGGANFGGDVSIGPNAPTDSLHVAGRIMMDTNAAASAADGAIRWSGSDFEGRKAGAWTSLTGVGAGGDITGVTAGAGLSGGGASGAVTVSVDTAYSHTWTAAQTFNARTTISDSIIVSDSVLVVNRQSGKVGIGTASPTDPLQVSANSSDLLRLKATSGGAATLILDPNAPSNSARIQGTTVGSNAELAFITGGSATERLRVDQSGRVGVGTTTPADSLHVIGTAKVSDSMVVGDSYLYVQSSGVGIRNKNPQGILDITTGNEYELRFSGTFIANINHNGSGVPMFMSTNGAQLSLGSNTDAEHLNIVGGKVGVGTAAPSDSLHIARGSFLISDNAASASLAVNNTGKVGIGTTTPGAKLDVVGSAKFSDSVIVSDTVLIVNKQAASMGVGCTNPISVFEVAGKRVNSATGQMVVTGSADHAYLQIRSSDGASYEAGLQIVGTGNVSSPNWGIKTPAGSSDLQVLSPSGGATALVLKPNGAVGVGSTAAPVAKLHVSGDARVKDTFVVQDTAFVLKENGHIGVGTASPGLLAGSATRLVDLEGGSGNVGVSMRVTGGAGHEYFLYTEGTAGTFRIFDATAATDRVVVDSAGNVGIGTTAPDTTLSVNGGASKVGGGSWATFSDGRLKNVAGEFTAGTAELMKINPVRYRYKRDNAVGIRDGAEHIGLVAQEVQSAIPEAVHPNKQGYLMLDNDPVIFAMLNAIKEQKAENDDLKAKVEELTKKVEAMEGGR